MRILITGYKGFIGQNMVNHLKNKHNVVLYEWGENHPSLEGIDQVIHLGAITSTTCTDKKAIKEKNYDYSINLISKCVALNIPIQISSSASVYGTTNTTFKETDNVDPKNLYAESKADIEKYCVNLNSNSPIQIFRYFNVYGQYEDHKGDQASPFHKFKEEYKKFGHVKLFKGSENFLRDFIHVNDVVTIQEKFFSINESGIWNLGTGKPKSFLDVALSVTDNIQWIEMPEILKNSYQSYTCANLEKLNKYLLKVPRIY